MILSADHFSRLIFDSFLIDSPHYLRVTLHVPTNPILPLCLFQWCELWAGGSSCLQGCLSSSYNPQAHRSRCDTHPVLVHLTLLRTLVSVKHLIIGLVTLARLSQKPHRPRSLPVLYSFLVKLLLHSLIFGFLFSHFPPFPKDAFETLRCLIGSFMLGPVPLPPSSMELALWAWCGMQCTHTSCSSAGNAPGVAAGELGSLTSASPGSPSFLQVFTHTLFLQWYLFHTAKQFTYLVPILPNIIHIFLVITQKLHFNFKKSFIIYCLFFQ